MRLQMTLEDSESYQGMLLYLMKESYQDLMVSVFTPNWIMRHISVFLLEFVSQELCKSGLDQFKRSNLTTTS